MATQLRYSQRAAQDIAKLDSVTKRRIKKKLEYFRDQRSPLQYAVRLTKAGDGQYRWRVGHYRVVFDVKGNVYRILRVQHRREVYKNI